MRYLVLLVAIIAGTPIFIIGNLIFPGVQFVLNKSPDADLGDYLAFVEITSATIFVAVGVSFWIAKMLKVPGFESGTARAWSTIASLPLLFCGPPAIIFYYYKGQWIYGSVCVLTTVTTASAIYLLNRAMRAANITQLQPNKTPKRTQ